MNETAGEDGVVPRWNLWFTELYKSRLGLALKVSRGLHSEASEFQRIDVIETEEFGTALVL